MIVELVLHGSRLVPVDVGGDPYDAILDSVRDCEAEGLHPVRVDAGDWLTLDGIRERIGVSREIVRLWAVGKQGPGGFPPPLNPDGKTKFYSWIETSRWLQKHTPHGPTHLDDPALAAMNLALQLRSMAPEITRIDAVVQCIAAGKEVPRT